MFKKKYTRPLAGQGASMAMLETFFLSNELKNNSDIKKGLLRYESILKSEIAIRQTQEIHLPNRFVCSPSKK